MAPAWISLPLSLAASAFIGYGDLHTDDTGIIAGLIAITSFMAAIVEPRHAWRWAAIIAAGVPIAEGWAQGIRRDVFLIALATCAFAFAGAYLAVLVRRLLTHERTSA
jgi:hypothetical protein